MPLSLGESEALASKLIAQCRPLCRKVEVAGAVRLKLNEPHTQITLVCRPEPKHLVSLDRLIVKWGTPLQSESQYGTMCLDAHTIFPDLSRIRIYWALPGQFGGLHFKQTGPQEFVWRMEAFWKKKGGDRFADGYLWRDGEMLLAESEEEFFGHLGVKPVPPEIRTRQAPALP